MTFQSINPYSQQRLKSYRADSAAALERKLKQADRAFTDWSALSLAERVGYLRRVGQYLSDHKGSLGDLITAEMGKTRKEGAAEVEKCATSCTYYADHADMFLADQSIDIDQHNRAFVTHQPLGPVLAIMPWNFPFWQVFRFAIPGLLAGNVGLLKHAPNVFGCAVAIEDVFRQCGLPGGVFQSLLIDVAPVERILDDKRVRAVTLTGSGRAGSSVAGIAGRAIKKSVLELGGSDALIVLADADLERAAETAVKSRMQNAGQSCIAAKRFIVEKSVKKQFTELVLHHIRQINQGDPMDDTTTMGPMARPDLADAIERQFDESVANGAKSLTGPVLRNGCNVQPMLLDRVKPGMAAFDEETFGPIAALIEAKDAADAIRLANQSDFGLGSALWTKDLDRADRLARQIQAGSVFVNGLMRSDARVPFGGIKNSGFGRELSEIGMKEFVNVKTVWIEG
ncbi:NAD-dependent succinate-semialdehyde dehydrogenase [Spirosoma utsteinense]|uniref:Succinate-semialdehyde dehydrogenase/glutarate-semialdehyde dehydrogenase n=1 Tax=Spirosoma utsteinense TaxID=2585773 RepID=A0ABR6W1Q4_9BACT|nr:NAD-dependent succinate-semialdehyde dehydrogenase [Spirosoma utsteinense]MBC3788196.1 succinate-semialdehyde dehydrogenase/glutarate-semialdehyde dehydrogenase [Spirosoma utsteinense]MBC3790455.1 succinate-semialdehyde dehydrogenase/glutarate-semialdehyde dehydrogenase [Spirosoma utsteinense]